MPSRVCRTCGVDEGMPHQSLDCLNDNGVVAPSYATAAEARDEAETQPVSQPCCQPGEDCNICYPRQGATAVPRQTIPLSEDDKCFSCSGDGELRDYYGRIDERAINHFFAPAMKHMAKVLPRKTGSALDLNYHASYTEGDCVVHVVVKVLKRENHG